MRLRLKEVRESRFLNQGELAERAGLSRASLNAIECGRATPRMTTVRRLAAALGVDPGELVAREGEPVPPGSPA